MGSSFLERMLWKLGLAPWGSGKKSLSCGRFRVKGLGFRDCRAPVPAVHVLVVRPHSAARCSNCPALLSHICRKPLSKHPACRRALPVCLLCLHDGRYVVSQAFRFSPGINGPCSGMGFMAATL